MTGHERVEPVTPKPPPSNGTVRLTPEGPTPPAGSNATTPPMTPAEAMEALRDECLVLLRQLDRLRAGKLERLESVAYFRETKQDIEAATAALSPDLRRTVRAEWDVVKASPLFTRRGPDLDPSRVLDEVATLEAWTHATLTDLGFQTIPDALRHLLATDVRGTTLRFHEVFAEDLPRQEDRDRVLRSISTADIPGVVERTSGTIYRHSRTAVGRAGWTLAMGLLLLATIGLLARPTLPETRWLGPLSGTAVLSFAGLVGSAALVKLWIATIGGIFAHDLASSFKGRPTLPALGGLGRLARWTDALWSPLAKRWAASLLLVVALHHLPLFGPPSPGTALLLGYGWQSALGVLVSLADRGADDQSERWREARERAAPVSGA